MEAAMTRRISMGPHADVVAQWLQGLSPEFGFSRVPVPHLPRGDGAR